MKTNIRAIPGTSMVGWLARFPDATPVAWEEDGGHFDGIRLADGQTFLVSTQYTPTAAQTAAAAATAAEQDAREAKIAAIIDNARAVVSDDKALIEQVNAGTLTNAQRDAAIKMLAKGQKALARAVLYIAKGEPGND